MAASLGKNAQGGTSGSGKQPGGGAGGDDSNSGPTGKLNNVKDISKTPSAVGDSGMVFSAGETKGAPDAMTPSTVPYTEVLPSYSKAAEKALDQEKVPPAYRKRVKDYFGSLE